MLNVEVPAGSLFYGKIRRRLDVDLDSSLRESTRAVAARLRELISAGTNARSHSNEAVRKMLPPGALRTRR